MLMCHTDLMRRPSLQDLLDEVRGQAGLDSTFGGRVETGAGGFVIEHVAGDRMLSLRNLDVAVGAGLGGKSLILGKPISVHNYQRASGITHHYDEQVNAAGLRSIFAMPVVVDSLPRAMIYGALRSPVPIGDRRLAVASRLLRRFELDLRVEDEVTRALDELDAAGSMARMREQLREVYAETKAIAERISDPQLRERAEALCERVRLGAASDVRPPATSLQLTPRELDVVAQVAGGRTNLDVSTELGLEVSTVKGYLKTAMRKAGVHNRTALVAECRRAGLLP